MKASNISRMVCFAVGGGSAFRGRPLFLIRLPPHGHSEPSRPIFSFPFAPAIEYFDTAPKGSARGCEDRFLFARFLPEGSLFGFKVFDEGCRMKALA